MRTEEIGGSGVCGGAGLAPDSLRSTRGPCWSRPPAETPLCPLPSVSAPCFPSLPAVHLKSQQPSVALPALRALPAPRGGPASRQAGGSSAFHAECLQVLVNCALTSQGGSGKAPLGLCCWEAQLGNPSPAAPGGCPPQPWAQSGAGRGGCVPQPGPSSLAILPACPGCGKHGLAPGPPDLGKLALLPWASVFSSATWECQEFPAGTGRRWRSGCVASFLLSCEL